PRFNSWILNFSEKARKLFTRSAELILANGDADSKWTNVFRDIKATRGVAPVGSTAPVVRPGISSFPGGEVTAAAAAAAASSSSKQNDVSGYAGSWLVGDSSAGSVDTTQSKDGGDRPLPP